MSHDNLWLGESFQCATGVKMKWFLSGNQTAARSPEAMKHASIHMIPQYTVIQIEQMSVTGCKLMPTNAQVD